MQYSADIVLCIVQAVLCTDSKLDSARTPRPVDQSVDATETTELSLSNLPPLLLSPSPPNTPLTLGITKNYQETTNY